jgi:hypothetical protein
MVALAKNLDTSIYFSLYSFGGETVKIIADPGPNRVKHVNQVLQTGLFSRTFIITNLLVQTSNNLLYFTKASIVPANFRRLFPCAISRSVESNQSQYTPS